MAPSSLYFDASARRYQKDCGGTSEVDAQSGIITSPGFPFTYPRNVTCNWLIRVSANKRIYIRLLHLQLSVTMGKHRTKDR